MDLNEFIYRDDSLESLGAAGAETPDDDAPATGDDTPASGVCAKAGLAAIGTAGLGLSQFLGQITRNL